MRRLLAMLAVACLLTTITACDGPTVPRLPQDGEEPEDTTVIMGAAPTPAVGHALV